jgi:hypothetical protein
MTNLRRRLRKLEAEITDTVRALLIEASVAELGRVAQMKENP